MRKPSVAGTALACLLTYALLMPELCVAAGDGLNVTIAQRIGQGLVFLFAFVLGVLSLRRGRFRIVRALLNFSVINFFAFPLMILLLLPGNEQAAEELFCIALPYLWFPYTFVQGGPSFIGLIRPDELPAILLAHFLAALVLTGLQVGALQLWYLVRGVWCAATRSLFGES